MAPKNYKRSQGQAERKGSKSSIKKVVVSYVYLDRAQGQTLEKWDETPGRLLRWSNIIIRLNSLTVAQALQESVIVIYNDLDVNLDGMPVKSKWKFPQHLKHKNIVWCKIVVMQLVRVIGFFEDNIFYVVFLDENHEFYPTEPKNT